MAFHGVVKTSSNLSPRPHKNDLQKKLAQVANLIGNYLHFYKKNFVRKTLKGPMWRQGVHFWFSLTVIWDDQTNWSFFIKVSRMVVVMVTSWVTISFTKWFPMQKRDFHWPIHNHSRFFKSKLIVTSKPPPSKKEERKKAISTSKKKPDNATVTSSSTLECVHHVVEST